jgi:hypothetical protein
LPVIRHARLGEHIAVAVKAWVNVSPLVRSSASLGQALRQPPPGILAPALVGDQQHQVRSPSASA